MTFFFFRVILYNMENIVLIGMPACGKSTAGVLAAKSLGYGFIDCDLVIQTQEKKLLSEIIAEKGAEGFIEIENRVNASLWADHCVIATGGSVVYGTEAMMHLSEIGKIIYLKLSYEKIKDRLGDFIVSRGVVIRKGNTLKELYEERIPLYEKYANTIVDCEDKNIEETVRAICLASKK